MNNGNLTVLQDDHINGPLHTTRKYILANVSWMQVRIANYYSRLYEDLQELLSRILSQNMKMPKHW